VQPHAPAYLYTARSLFQARLLDIDAMSKALFNTQNFTSRQEPDGLVMARKTAKVGRKPVKQVRFEWLNRTPRVPCLGSWCCSLL